LWVLPSIFSLSDFDAPRAQQVYLWTYLTNVRMSWLNAWCFGPLDHFWSLAVEEHFYLVWPFVVFFLSSKALLRLTVFLILVVGAARLLAIAKPELDVAIDVLTVFRLDGLCFGAALAVIMRQGFSASLIEKVAKWLLPILIGFLLIVAAVGKRLLGLPNSVCPATWAILLGLLLTRPVGHWMSHLAKMDFLRWLGKYSYGMYVVQLPLLSVITPRWVTDGLSTITTSRLLVYIAYVPIMFSLTMLLGFLTYHLLEKHFLRLKRAWE
jgi:peptidoglycan/LPS O-acetylase OafA/YrhL